MKSNKSLVQLPKLALLAVLVASLLLPLPVSAASPDQPVNTSPVDGAEEVSLSPTLRGSDFVDPDDDEHYASRWQITTNSTDYTNPVFDSGVTTEHLTEITVPYGCLQPDTTYYWRVRYTDDAGERSLWSVETSFVTVVETTPIRPYNVSPASESTGVGLTPTLVSSPFASPDPNATHEVSRWQITGVAGEYDDPVWDSGMRKSDLTSITVPAGFLMYDSEYFWRVRYMDSWGKWSSWSGETSFSTLASGGPYRPANVSPADNAHDVVLTPTLMASAFWDPDDNTHAASRWQITTTRGDYSLPIYDSGLNEQNLTQITVPENVLSYGTTYYWRGRYQDSSLQWSEWSYETSFETVAPHPPNQPSYISPAPGSVAVGLTPALQSSDFSDPDLLTGTDAHTASAWQITTTAGDYSNPTFSSGADTSNLTKITVPQGVLTYSTTYYWRVRHRDQHDMWSNWSTETMFTTLSSTAPRQPSNLSPADETANLLTLTPTLQASVFSDSDARDSQTAAQWQITTVKGDYSAPVVDEVTADKSMFAQFEVPPARLEYSTTYFWRVRYRDSYDNWSAYSAETSFSTIAAQASFSGTPVEVGLAQSVTFSDNSIGHISSWTWSFGDGTTVTWTDEDRPSNGKVVHFYQEAGTYTVSLRVVGDSGEDIRMRAGYVTVVAPETSDGLPVWTWIAGVLLVGFLGAFVLIRLRNR